MKEIKIKFYSTKEKMPEKSGFYLCVMNKNMTMVLGYSKKYGLFNIFDHQTEEEAKEFAVDCMYWADCDDLAELAKGDGNDD